MNPTGGGANISHLALNNDDEPPAVSGSFQLAFEPFAGCPDAPGQVGRGFALNDNSVRQSGKCYVPGFEGASFRSPSFRQILRPRVRVRFAGVEDYTQAASLRLVMYPCVR
jgi:hypothetical protein